MIRLLIVDDVESTREHLKKLLGFETDIEVCGTAEDGLAAIEAAQKLNPDVILMDINMPVMDGIQSTERIAQEMPTTPVIIMSVQGERDYLRRAMQAGAREFLIKPFSYDELVASVRRVHQLEQKKTPLASEQGGGHGLDGKKAHGHIIAVLAGKGGVGTSVVAVNIAAGIKQLTNERVLLIDSDLQFGDVGVMLNSDNSRSIVDIANSTPVGTSIEDEVLDEVLVAGPDGMRLLLAPLSPELADLIGVELFRNILGMCKSRFDYIVIDTACHVGDLALESIEQAEYLVLVTTPAIPALKDTKLMLNVLDSLNIDDHSIKLVLNHTDVTSGFTKEATEKNLQFAVSVEIPYDAKTVAESLLRGSPWIGTHPDGELTKAVMKIASSLIPEGVGGGHAGEGGDKTPGGEKRRSRRGLFGKG